MVPAMPLGGINFSPTAQTSSAANAFTARQMVCVVDGGITVGSSDHVLHGIDGGELLPAGTP